MKKLILAAAIATTFCAGLARADDVKPSDAPATAAPTPDNVVAYNVGVASDYRYRGISQTRLDPALQGGVDYTNNPTGYYLGTWLSSIKWITDVGGSDDVEWDLYGGKRGDIIKDKLSYDVGVLSYVYPSNELHPNANTTEIYGQLGYGPSYYAKYSYSVTNLFGFVDSKKSGYLDIGANIDVGNGFTINLHGGRQTVKNNSDFSYTDWKAGVTKDFGVVSGALAVISTNTSHYTAPNGDNLGKTALVLVVTKTF
ncbi:MAG: TorF family putative porin [Burkholderiales bacterium]